MAFNIVRVQQIIEQLSNIHVNKPELRATVIQYTVAKALAFDAPIPTQQVDSVRSYYLENVARPLEALLAAVNEVVVLNFTTTAETAYRIWAARVRLVYDPLVSDDLDLYQALNAKALMDQAAREGYDFEAEAPKTLKMVVADLVELFNLDEVKA